MIWTLFRSSGNFPDRLETFQIIQTQFKIIQTLFRLSRHISKLSGHFRIIRKLSRSPQVPGTFLDHWALFRFNLETFSRLSGYCLESTETFQIIRTRDVDRILKSRIKSDLKSRIKSDLKSRINRIYPIFLTGRKPLLSWSFLDGSHLCRTSGSRVISV